MSMQSKVMAAIQMGIRTVEVFSLKKATDIANHLWLRPMKIPMRPGDEATQKTAERFEVQVRGVTYQVESWGKGPLAMLVHGWDGRASQMYKFVAPLVSAGFRVVAFDVPANGSAPGNQVDPSLAGDVVKAVIAKCGGSLDALITHSFGSSWALVGITTGNIPVKRVVLISPPYSLRKIFDKFCYRLKLSDRVRSSVEKRFVQIHGDLWTKYSNDHLVKRLGAARGLVIHDENDKEVPFAEGVALAEQWPGCEFKKTTGLGHYRVLKSDDVIGHAVSFVKASADGAAPSAAAASTGAPYASAA